MCPGMGTWDIGPFDNDPAADAVAAIVDGTFRMDQFRYECGLGPLGTDEAESIIALAAVLNGYLPARYADKGVNVTFSIEDKQWIRRRAQSVVRPGGSELYAMWEDAGELDEWLAAAKKYAV